MKFKTLRRWFRFRMVGGLPVVSWPLIFVVGGLLLLAAAAFITLVIRFAYRA